MLIKKIIKHERVPIKSPQGYNVSMIITSFQEEARNEAIKYCNITINSVRMHFRFTINDTPYKVNNISMQGHRIVRIFL